MVRSQSAAYLSVSGRKITATKILSAIGSSSPPSTVGPARRAMTPSSQSVRPRTTIRARHTNSCDAPWYRSQPGIGINTIRARVRMFARFFIARVPTASDARMQLARPMRKRLSHVDGAGRLR
jgi:hypothetical protein